MQHVPNVPFGEEDEERSQQHVRAIETFFMCDPERHYCRPAMCVVPAFLAAKRKIIIWYFKAVFTQKIMITLWLTVLFIKQGCQKRMMLTPREYQIRC